MILYYVEGNLETTKNYESNLFMKILKKLLLNPYN